MFKYKQERSLRSPELRGGQLGAELPSLLGEGSGAVQRKGRRKGEAAGRPCLFCGLFSLCFRYICSGRIASV